MNIIFLDIDGVFNCQIFYEKSIAEAKKGLRKKLKAKDINGEEYCSQQLCKERISWFNKLCEETGAKIVVSSTWRLGKTIEQLQATLNNSGATFEIIDTTPICRFEGAFRGNEIQLWLEKNIEQLCGVKYYNFKRYAIIDDDSDMLYWQRNNFFQTDGYSGLTPTTCYKVKMFFDSFKGEELENIGQYFNGKIYPEGYDFRGHTMSEENTPTSAFILKN